MNWQNSYIKYDGTLLLSFSNAIHYYCVFLSWVMGMFGFSFVHRNTLSPLFAADTQYLHYIALLAMRSRWPSGLRRWIQERGSFEGVGSNPTYDFFLFWFLFFPCYLKIIWDTFIFVAF